MNQHSGEDSEVGGRIPGAGSIATGPLDLIFSGDLDATVKTVEAVGGVFVE